MRAKDYRQEARQVLSGNWGVAVGTTLAALLLGGVSSGSSFEIKFEQTETVQVSPEIRQMLMELIPYIISGALLAVLFSIFVSTVVSLGYHSFHLDMMDGQSPKFKTLFSRFAKGCYFDSVKLSVLTGLYTFGWSLLFVIPGIVASYSYAMAPYIRLENPGLTANECIALSKEMMQGRKWKLFCLDLSFMGWSLLASLTFGIGNLFLVPYQYSARTAFYRNITNPRVGDL